ncbi:MAG: PAS domain-containing sensor histidine kinase [Bacteroidales bacterium]|jgi:PAS domain S-box-containing protein|nr:PAS domain-containing sensor histidine kinase [Bacteroidales bacterium]
MYLHKPGHISYDVLSDMIYNSGLVILKISPAGEILYSNNYFESVFGYKHDEIIGKSFTDIIFNISANDASEVQTTKPNDILNNVGHRQFEIASRTKNDEIHWFFWQISPFNHPSADKHMGYYCVGQEITHRKRIETRLAESEKKLNDFVNLLPEIVFEVNANMQIIFINQRCIDFVGYSKEDFLQNKVHLQDIIIPEDFIRMNKIFVENFNGIRNTGNTFGVIHKNGSLLNVQIHSNPVWDEKKVVSLRCIAINITDKARFEKKLKEQEEKFRLIYENSPIPYQSLNTFGDIIEINPAWLKIMGYTREEVVGENFAKFLVPELRELFLKRFENFKSIGEIKDLQFQLMSKDGRIFIANYNGKIETNEAGKFIKSHCVFNDITLQIKAENTLIQSEQKLRELNATKDKFFSILAHDLKNPFNDIIGFSYLLSSNIYKYDLPKIEQFSNIIHQSAKLTFNLLENLLDWSRSQTGNLKFIPESFDINELIIENIDLFQSTANNKNIKLFNEVDGVLQVYADKNMIRTIIRNLISNAIKFTNQGGFVRITGSLSKSFVTISVVDNGVGINYDDQKKLFRIDTNVTRQGTEKERGTGLGLILCKEFIERNGGKIDFESQPGRGSRYFFSVPAANKENDLFETE